jgi:hypothetical protein
LAGATLAFLAVLAPSWLLAGKERGWTTIAAAQLAAQQVLHPLLVAASPTPTPDALPHDAMFLLHVLGALGMASWLRHGERRMWASARRLVACLALWTRWLLHVPAAVPPARMPAVFLCPSCPATVLLRHVLSRRAPPLPA